MNRRDNIIANAESDFGLVLDDNFNDDSLCDGDVCRHSECECWDRFEMAVREQLVRQRKKYRGEVTAGIHVPKGEDV